jgi:hypothetical protein
MNFLYRVFLLCGLSSLTQGFLVRVDPTIVEPIRICANCRESFAEEGQLKCALFYNMNPVLGYAIYFSCSTARQSKELCGLEAKYYVYESTFGPIEEEEQK